MDLMAVTDNIVNPIFFERLGNLRQFLELSLSEIFNREVKILPQVKALGQLFNNPEDRFGFKHGRYDRIPRDHSGTCR